MTVDYLMVEKMCQLVFGHSDARISNADLDIAVGLLRTNRDATTLRCKLAGIVGQRVQHEKCQYAVCLHHSLCRFYL